MNHSGFSAYHPVVNFLFFVGAIGFGVLVQHPAYIAAGIVCGMICVLTMKGAGALKLIGGMIPMFVLISLINPLFNTQGRTVMLTIFGRPYTWEALCYGMTLAGMFVLMMLWFSCYNQVLTSDKFICLFGSLIPSLSLLLVMVLRLIPSFMRKTKQILDARNAIGRGGNDNTSMKEKAHSGMTVLSALTDWALEGSIVTADSMRSRGYGSAKRTSFRRYRMTRRDWLVIGVELVLAGAVIAAICTGGTKATYTYRISITPVTPGFGAYCAFLLIPALIEWKEEVQWRFIRSKI